VRLGEETTGLGGVVPYGHVRVMLVQARLGTVAAKLEALGWGCGVLVGGFEGAVAVVPFGHVRTKPAVAWAVLIPEGMVYGEDGVAPFGRVQEKPEDLMIGTGMNGGGWHDSGHIDSQQINVRPDLRFIGHPPRIRRLLPSHPDEYAAVCEAYHDHEETLLHDQWERMRLLATITIQPHVKGKVTPERLLPFPWDSSGLGHGNNRAETKKTSPRPVSKEEDKKRFEALMKRMKL